MKATWNSTFLSRCPSNGGNTIGVPGFARDGAIGSKGFKAFCVWLEQGYKSLPLRDCDR